MMSKKIIIFAAQEKNMHLFNGISLDPSIYESSLFPPLNDSSDPHLNPPEDPLFSAECPSAATGMPPTNGITIHNPELNLTSISRVFLANVRGIADTEHLLHCNGSSAAVPQLSNIQYAQPAQQTVLTSPYLYPLPSSSHPSYPKPTFTSAGTTPVATAPSLLTAITHTISPLPHSYTDTSSGSSSGSMGSREAVPFATSPNTTQIQSQRVIHYPPHLSLPQPNSYQIDQLSLTPSAVSSATTTAVSSVSIPAKNVNSSTTNSPPKTKKRKATTPPPEQESVESTSDEQPQTNQNASATTVSTSSTNRKKEKVRAYGKKYRAEVRKASYAGLEAICLCNELFDKTVSQFNAMAQKAGTPLIVVGSPHNSVKGKMDLIGNMFRNMTEMVCTALDK